MSFTSASKYLRQRTSGKFINIAPGGHLYLSSSVIGDGKSIDFEINEKEKTIRLKVTDNGLINVASCHQGFLNAEIARILIGINRVRAKIELELSNDGWWYGSYADNSNGEESQ
jgi:hypothetical protein